jgi:bacillithiol biosynthesis cysteine-adding enzyme BshC
VLSDTQKTDATAIGIPIDIRRLPWSRKLTWDYAFAFGGLASFFARDPSRRESWGEMIRLTEAHPRPREEVAAILEAQQHRRGAPREARSAAARLRDGRSVAIVTGQQAGLFGGPLFTLLKALTAIKLAARVEREHHVPAVPVFWIDAEDHDWAEVATCAVLDAEFALKGITLPAPAGAGEVPVASIRLDQSIVRAVDELGATLPATEFTRPLVDQLAAAYAPGRGMAEAFGRLLEQTLGPIGLVVFDSSDPAAKPLVKQVFIRELQTPGVSARLAAEIGARLGEAGYHAQVTPVDGTVSLFHLDGGRQPIRKLTDTLRVGNASVPVNHAALIAAAEREPQRFSPNVLLRPIVQDSLFPTVSYIAGPSELAYLGQLREVYEHFGVPMPIVYPRATATLLDSAAARFLMKYDVPLERLRPRDEAALNRLLEAQLPVSVERAYEDAEAAVRARMEAVIAAVPAIDPTLEGAARSTLGKMQHDLGALHDKIIHAAKRRDATLRRQFARTRALSFPEGHPQERAVGFVYFLNRYGPALIDRLAADLPVDPGTHWILTI